MNTWDRRLFLAVRVIRDSIKKNLSEMKEKINKHV